MPKLSPSQAQLYQWEKGEHATVGRLLNAGHISYQPHYTLAERQTVEGKDICLRS